MTLTQILLILRARYRLVLIALCGTVAATLAVSLLLPRQYTTGVDVVMDVKSPDPVAGMVLPAMTMPGYMATQVDIINSDRVTYRVIKLLKFDADPTLRSQWLEATDGQTSFEAWFSAVLQKKLSIKPSRESNVIRIEYTARDPKFAAAIANAYAQAYIDTDVELHTESAKQYAQWFDQQVKGLRDGVEQAQARLSAYQQKNGLLNSDDRLDFENQKLNELQTQVVLAEAAAADARSKQKSASWDSAQDVMQNPTVQQLKSEIAMQEAKLQDASRTLGPNHPQYLSMAAQISSLKQKLTAETAQVATSVNTARRANIEKVAELKAAIASHKKSVLEMTKSHDEAAALKREVEAAQKAYDIVSDRYNQSSLESKSTQSNIAVLTPAAVPFNPSSPKTLLNLAVSALLGALLGIASAVMTELRGRRIRSSSDFEEALGIPLLSTMNNLPAVEPRRLPRHKPASGLTRVSPHRG